MSNSEVIAFWACPYCLQKVAKDQERCHHCTTLYADQRIRKYPFPCDSNGNPIVEKGNLWVQLIVLFFVFVFISNSCSKDQKPSAKVPAVESPIDDAPTPNSEAPSPEAPNPTSEDSGKGFGGEERVFPAPKPDDGSAPSER